MNHAFIFAPDMHWAHHWEKNVKAQLDRSTESVGGQIYTTNMDELTRPLKSLLSDAAIETALAAFHSGFSTNDVAVATQLHETRLRTGGAERPQPRTGSLATAGECPPDTPGATRQAAQSAFIAGFSYQLAIKHGKIFTKLINCDRESHDIFLRRTTLAMELRSMNKQINRAETSCLGFASLQKLVSEHDRIVRQLRELYQRHLVVTGDGQRACKEATKYFDASLHAYGLSVAEIHDLGGNPRTTRTVYRHDAGYPKLGAECIALVKEAMPTLVQRSINADRLKIAIRKDLRTLRRAPGQTTLHIDDGDLQKVNAAISERSSSIWRYSVGDRRTA